MPTVGVLRYKRRFWCRQCHQLALLSSSARILIYGQQHCRRARQTDIQLAVTKDRSWQVQTDVLQRL